MGRRLTVRYLATSLSRYNQGLALQEQLAEARRAGQIDDQLLLMQHRPVYTLGKRGSKKDFRLSQQELEEQGIEVANVSRGGEVTFHGPGQLVAYPIAAIRDLKVGARAWVEGLENCVVRVAEAYGVQAREVTSLEKETGRAIRLENVAQALSEAYTSEFGYTGIRWVESDCGNQLDSFQ
eukprot:CAMPEP_0117653960 /NCGR_PEP_ID=MMETSP0804-20121206/3481_1 /TAXON_ID=1074897 /ORGANISM="Tetraselmis astigmatica, Strain CCMP880" /LENGTH=179 /DNA_ID=CAMNT_0005460193 /DNA_START=248 /DNA_END=787 /DNA_ORIENTATION=+